MIPLHSPASFPPGSARHPEKLAGPRTRDLRPSPPPSPNIRVQSPFSFPRHRRFGGMVLRGFFPPCRREPPFPPPRRPIFFPATFHRFAAPAAALRAPGPPDPAPPAPPPGPPPGRRPRCRHRGAKTPIRFLPLAARWRATMGRCAPPGWGAGPGPALGLPKGPAPLKAGPRGPTGPPTGAGPLGPKGRRAPPGMVKTPTQKRGF